MALVLGLFVAGCATEPPPPPKTAEAHKPKPLPPGLDPFVNPDPFPSTYRPLPSVPTAIVNAHILTAAGREIERGTVVMAEGKVVAVGPDVQAPAGAQVIDANGRWVTPGIIDPHSHLGVYPSPAVPALSDGNEATDPNTAQVWAEHSVWPQDPGFGHALAGGVTTLEILPGSANLFGGRSVVLKNVAATTAQAMKFPGAPYDLKMACGENPKRVYGSKGRSPATLMGNVAGYRAGWIKAREYLRKWDDYKDKIGRGEKAEAPARDLQLDTLAGVLRGEIRIQNHCYRADEMAQMIDISHEFGFHIAAFHHASESYKIADLLKREGICSVTWTTWFGFKMESYDGIEENVAMLQHAGACATLSSDDENLIQHLNVEAALAMGAGNRAGLGITRDQAFAWISLNPAKALGIADKTGSLEPGKMADVVLWSRDPFSVYATPDKVFIDGGLAYDAHDRRYQPQSDFMLGQPGQDAAVSGAR
ncbi:amidohydrolase [Caulobacter sp. S45]|uniref:amidohydrolase n=1 Tax=Caulobacter sp. S45 TaxID=1641861 RepID=UPI00131E279B|nr:amidohydrolase [Caulobacter sp. S45]